MWGYDCAVELVAVELVVATLPPTPYMGPHQGCAQTLPEPAMMTLRCDAKQVGNQLLASLRLSIFLSMRACHRRLS